MYIPKSFQQDDLPTLHDLMRRFNFATLVSQHEGSLFATHLPFLLAPSRGKYGTLIAHMARANPQWKDLSGEVLVIFQGAHSEISPAWYANPVTVPTWNYATVHVYGTPRLIHETYELREMVAALVDYHETEWNISSAEPIMEANLQAIVGLEIPIDRLEGKYKFNQNRSREDQAGVVKALEISPDPLQRETADIIRANLAKD